MIDKIPVPVIPSNKYYYPAQRFSKEILPLLLREELSFTQQPYQDAPVFTNIFPFTSVMHSPLDLVHKKEEKKIIEIVPSFWFDGYASWVSLFDRIIERAGYETIQSNATHFSLDMFTAHIWFSVFPEYYCGLGLSARLQMYVRRDLWM